MLDSGAGLKFSVRNVSQTIDDVISPVAAYKYMSIKVSKISLQAEEKKISINEFDYV